jgi:hypothetical protein
VYADYQRGNRRENASNKTSRLLPLLHLGFNIHKYIDIAQILLAQPVRFFQTTTSGSTGVSYQQPAASTTPDPHTYSKRGRSCLYTHIQRHNDCYLGSFSQLSSRIHPQLQAPFFTTDNVA